MTIPACLIQVVCKQASVSPKAQSLRDELTKCIKKAKRPANNISKGEFKALQELKADTDITILPAKIPKIPKKIGSGWVGPGLIWIKKNWKIVQKQSFASVQFVPICPLWCSNIKSKIGVGRHAVSRYNQLKKFFIAGDDPGYRDHDFPTPGYLICLSGYMVIQHPQSGNTQDASGRNNVKFGHT